MITFTENATNKINDLLTENQENFLRIFVKGGGCTGFMYGFEFAEKQEDDLKLEIS